MHIWIHYQLESLSLGTVKYIHGSVWRLGYFLIFKNIFPVVCITHSLNVSIKQLWSAKCSDWSFFVVAVRPESETMCT